MTALGSWQYCIPSVYTPVNTSIYSPVYPSAPHPKVVEIASLITELYDLFIDMRYLPASFFSFPPHSHVPIGLLRPASFGITKDVVDLWQMIPQHNRDEHARWNYLTGFNELFAGGRFLTDLRGDLDQDNSWPEVWADPFYGIYDMLYPPTNQRHDSNELRKIGWDHENGPYMKPWYAVLTLMGGRGTTIVLDTKTWEIWLVDQMGDGSQDPLFRGTKHRYIQDHGCTNEYDLRQYPSRPATEFFNDIINRFKLLEWIPGGIHDYDDDVLCFEEFKAIYKEAGWPSNFNPLRFDQLLKDIDGGEWGNDDALVERFQSSESDGMTEEQVLNRLGDVIASEKRLILDQIFIVDARYRLAHDKLNKDERQTLEVNLKSREKMANPSLLRWKEEQGRLAIELEFRTQDLQAIRTRTGRYTGPGWAGVTDEELRTLYEGKREFEEQRIAKLKAHLGDTNLYARHSRVFEEAKAAVAALPNATWRLPPPGTLKGNDGLAECQSDSHTLNAAEVTRYNLTLEEFRKWLVYSFDHDRIGNKVDTKRWENKNGLVVIAEAPSSANAHPLVQQSSVDLEASGRRYSG